VEQVSETVTPQEQVQAQQEVIQQQVEQATELNFELEDIIGELRRKKGLPPRPAYKAPNDLPIPQVEAPELIVGPTRAPDGEEGKAAKAPPPPPPVEEESEEDD
jgi:hypothetical protein